MIGDWVLTPGESHSLHAALRRPARVLGPALAVNLVVLSGINYLLALLGGILAALLVGGLVEQYPPPEGSPAAGS